MLFVKDKKVPCCRNVICDSNLVLYAILFSESCDFDKRFVRGDRRSSVVQTRPIVPCVTECTHHGAMCPRVYPSRCHVSPSVPITVPCVTECTHHGVYPSRCHVSPSVPITVPCVTECTQHGVMCDRVYPSR